MRVRPTAYFLAISQLLLLACAAQGQDSSETALNRQRADKDYLAAVKAPAFAAGTGPLVLLDEAHVNYHTVEGRYAPFVELLRKDGYRVQANTKEFTKSRLEQADALVIANALAKENRSEWKLPTPSAFSQGEIAAVREWVSEGGSLLLIADHMPFAGAATDLAAAFHVEFLNGFAMPKAGGRLRFDQGQHSLHRHAILRGRVATEAVQSVTTFTGSAFRCSPPFEPLLEFGQGVESLQPRVAWQFDQEVQRVDCEGWYQGAVARIGDGRIAVFGEAAMFSAQRSGGGRPMGMNSPEAKENAQFLLNTMHWLSGLLEAQ